MAAHVTLRNRTDERAARMVAAVADLKRSLAAYAHEHGGRFVFFGSAARREMRQDSDVDIVVDFPSGLETEAVTFAESECRRLGLKPDVLSHGWAGARLRDRLRQEGLFLPGDEDRWAGAMSMTDRLDDILDATRSAASHFRAAGRLFQESGFELGGETGYRNRMAFLHAMLSGHTALEDALVRVMKALGEAPPTGSDWYQRVLERAAKAKGKQPALLSSGLAAAADRTRAFRHFAARAYSVEFNPEKAKPAVEAADLIARQIEGEMRKFLDRFDQNRPA